MPRLKSGPEGLWSGSLKSATLLKRSATSYVVECGTGGLMVEHDLIQPYLKGVDGNLDAVMGLGSETVLKLMRKVITQ